MAHARKHRLLLWPNIYHNNNDNNNSHVWVCLHIISPLHVFFCKNNVLHWAMIDKIFLCVIFSYVIMRLSKCTWHSRLFKKVLHEHFPFKTKIWITFLQDNVFFINFTVKYQKIVIKMRKSVMCCYLACHKMIFQNCYSLPLIPKSYHFKRVLKMYFITEIDNSQSQLFS